MLALQSLIKDLQPEDLANEEVEVREDWLDTQNSPKRGVTIFDMGEQYDDGTCGTQDIGYICGIVFAKFRTTDAVLSDDKIIQWYELVRRRLMDQRCLTNPVIGPSAPSEHVCIVMPGRTLTNSKNWPNYLIRMIVVSAWVRELPTT